MHMFRGLAFGTALVQVYLVGFGEMRPACMHQVTVGIVFFYFLADVRLHAIHIKRRQELTIRHGLYVHPYCRIRLQTFLHANTMAPHLHSQLAIRYHTRNVQDL